MHSKTKKRYAAIVLLCMLIQLVPAVGLAETNTDGMWQTGQTQNLIPELQPGRLDAQGWGNVGKEINQNAYDTGYGLGIRAESSGNDIGSDDYTGGVYYTIRLSEEDQARANKGDLSITASTRNYIQGAAEHCFSIRAECYGQNNQTPLKIIRRTKYTHRWGVTDSSEVVELNSQTVSDTQIPAGTVYIQFWVSNWGSLGGRPWIAQIQCYLHDTTSPKFSRAYLNIVDVVDEPNNICIAGDTIEYCVEFDEAVELNSATSAVISLQGEEFESTQAESSGNTIIYTFQIPEFQSSGTISLKEVKGCQVRDDAGNSYTYEGSPEAGTIYYYKTMSVANDLTGITTSNTQTTAQYGTDYNTALTANVGYQLPSSITVTAGGTPLAGNSDYTYNSTSGYLSIKGKAIKGDIKITAAANPGKYAVILDGSGATNAGTTSVTATFGSPMPQATMPQKTGYTFHGYFTQKEGGTKYYNADGTSAQNFDIAENTTLYAQWTANTYLVRYHQNKPDAATNQVLGTMADSSFIYDQQGNLSAVGYTLTGWEFLGWATTPGGQHVYTDAQSVKNLAPSGIFDLYAVWQQTTNNISLNAAGGSGSTTVTATYDAPMPGAPIPSKPGYTFQGYFDQEEGGVQYYDADGNSARNWDKTVDTVLYAQWKAIEYHIQFYSMGEFVGQELNVVYGKIRLPSAESLGISREHYNFVGWNIYDEQNWGMYMADTDYNVGLSTKDGETVYLYAAWLEKDKFQITYDANGGSGAPAAVEVHQDETITLSQQVPVRKNYTFLGWATSSDAQVPEYQPSESFTMGNSLVTLYAVWQKNPMLSYDSNGGSFSYYVEATYPPSASSVTITEAAPIKEGYRFKGWATQKDAQVAEYTAGDTMTMPVSDTVLYAVWERLSYPISQTVAEGYSVNGLQTIYYHGDTATFTVSGDMPIVYINGVEISAINGSYSFTVTSDTAVVVVSSTAFHVIYHANGGENAPIDIFGYESGSEAKVLNGVPDRVGYSFLGWSDTPSAESGKYQAGDVLTISADTTLYAVWKPNSYTIVFDAREGSGEMAPMEARYDDTVTLSTNTFTRRGYRFLGWTTDPDYGVMYPDMASVKNLTADNSATVTLYALWETSTTTIFLDAAGGAGGSTSVSVNYDAYLSSRNLTAPKRYGYKFGGYYTEKDGHGEFLFDAAMNVSGRYASEKWDIEEENLTLYAFWIPVEYSIVYINGSQQLDKIQPARFGDTFSLYTGQELGIVTQEGYHLAGWSIASGSNSVYYTDGQTITTGLTGTDGDTVYLYAVIAENDRYTITYDANGGSGAPESQTAQLKNGESSITIKISNVVPQKDGYIFKGWNTKSDSTGTDYSPGDEISISADTTLYAVWEKLGEYYVAYHENTSDEVYGMPAPQNKVEGVALSLSKTVPLRTGYRFLGWAETPDGPVKYAAGAEHEYHENKSLDLYAVWEAESFTVKLPESGAGYTVSEAGAQKTVGYGGELEFTVTIAQGYTAERMIVSANGVSLGFTSVKGDTYTYVLKNVTKDTVISINDVVQISYTVVLNDGTGYTVAPNTQTVSYGEDLSFRVTLADGYQTAVPKVYANGLLLAGIQDGDTYTYTLPQVKQQPSISISIVEKPQYSIVFVNGENIYTISTVEEGQPLTEPAAPERAGYRFAGWYLDKEMTKPYTFGGAVTSAFILYAKWEINTYQIEYFANTQDTVTALPSIQIKQHDVPLVLSSDLPKRTGYRFLGWNTKPDGTGTSYGPADEFIANTDTNLYAQWKRNVYTITFRVDNAVYRTVQAEYGALLDEITPPSKDGLIFSGWYHNTMMWNFGVDRVEGDMTLQAVFSDQTFTVTPPVSGEGYEITLKSDETVPFGGSFSFTITALEHYNLDHIRVLANGRILLPEVSGNEYHYTIQNIASDYVITVDGVEKNSYTVEYIVDGEVYRSCNAVFNSTLQKPLSPSKEGHTFTGWLNGDSPWNFESDTVTDHLTLTASWEINRYSVTLPASTAEYTITTQDSSPVDYLASFSFTVTVADGYDSDTIKVLVNGIEAVAETAQENVFTYVISNIAEPKTVTIRGIGQNTYSVVYKPGTIEYVGGMPDGAIKTHGVDLVLSDQIPVRTGYQFLGWATDPDSEKIDYQAGATYEINADMTLYALWNPNTYRVVYEENGGESIPDAEYVYGQGLTLPTKEEMIQDGFEFIGWYDNARLEGSAVTEVTREDMGDKTYYARWEALKITPQGYEGIYDGESHFIRLQVASPMEIEGYQWYFKAEGSDGFVPVYSDRYDSFAVSNTSDSGIYYCYLEAVRDGYVVRFATNECTVKILNKEITISASDASKVYDANPLVNAEFTQSGLASDKHQIEVLMTSDSTITNVGSCANKIETVVIRDENGMDITGNYHITKTEGTLTVTPFELTVKGKNATVYRNRDISLHTLYIVEGLLGAEKLSANVEVVSIQDSNGNKIENLNEVSRKVGTYTIVISYNGFTGEGQENYTGSGTFASEVTVRNVNSGSSGGGGGGGGISVTRYTITFDTQGGSKVASKTVNENTTVSEPAEPTREGYRFDGWYTDQSCTAAYNFDTKVTKNITLYAKWVEDTQNPTGPTDPEDPDDPNEPTEPENPEGPKEWENPFTDVKEEDWFYDAVKFAEEKGLFSGTTETTFSPNMAITRAMLVTVLWRAEEKPAVDYLLSFEDIDKEAYYAEAVRWAASVGIVKGYSDTEFAPDKLISREEMAAIINRYAAEKGVDTSVRGDLTKFTDQDQISDWARANVEWAVGYGLISGKENNMLDPQGSTTRAEVAAILQRLMEQ